LNWLSGTIGASGLAVVVASFGEVAFWGPEAVGCAWPAPEQAKAPAATAAINIPAFLNAPQLPSALPPKSLKPQTLGFVPVAKRTRPLLEATGRSIRSPATGAAPARVLQLRPKFATESPVLNPPSEAFLAELEARLGPRGFTRAAEDMMPWLTDWRGRCHGRAAALLSPHSLDEVQTIVSRCAGERVALVPQGGNTSMVGGATPDAGGDALLLSLRRMNRVRSVSAEDNVVVAEAGVILADLHGAAEAAGRRFPLSLGAKGSATVGGLVSTNAGGTQVLRFGSMRALTLGLEAVLPGGAVHRGLSPLRKDNRGYDLKQLLIGAEGTLGVVTAAALRLAPLPGSSAVAWLGLRDPAAALMLLRRLEAQLGEAVESFELVPARALRLVLAHVPGTRAPLAEEAPWNVLVETTAPAGAPDAREALEAVLAGALDEGLLLDAAIAASERERAELWRLRETIAEAERQEGPAVKHDVSVPVSAVAGFLRDAEPALAGAFPGVRVVAFGHLGDGNIHYNVQPPPEAEPAQWLSAHGAELTRFVHDLVVALGGSISAEHGIGQTKLDEFARTAEPERLAALRAIRHALDPGGTMNPGKLFR
jgi:FAD/FMN-containing dehydrogenase